MNNTKNVMNYFLSYKKLQQLIDLLVKADYEVRGPVVRDGAIIFDSINRIEQFPWGITDQQLPGQYRLSKCDKKKAFLWSNGPESLKKFLFKPSEVMWSAKRDSDGNILFRDGDREEESKSSKSVALIGARPCDLHAMQVQDNVFLNSKHLDHYYKKYRDTIFIIAVNCIHSGKNCFCLSAGGSPKAKHHFDIALTEIENGFVSVFKTERAKNFSAQLELEQASDAQLQEAKAGVNNAVKMQSLSIPFKNSSKLRDELLKNLEHPRWKDVAQRCLACGNCTSVCPTCFCHTEIDIAELDGKASEHRREWDSCFTAGHSYIAGKGVIRDDIRKRYRQWLTHKLGTWHDQFGESGCIGCGRCVTWCPVGINIVEEVTAIVEPKVSEEKCE